MDNMSACLINTKSRCVAHAAHLPYLGMPMCPVFLCALSVPHFAWAQAFITMTRFLSADNERELHDCKNDINAHKLAGPLE